MDQGQGPLRVGLVGAGMISRHHLIGWSRAGDARVVAICDPVRARAEDRARAFAIAAVHESIDALLAAEPIDALDVTSPRETHAEVVRRAIERGLPVLCQKPLAPSLAEAEALVAEAAPRIRLMVHENWRFRPFYREVKRWLEAGRIGAPVQVRLTYFSAGLLPDSEGRIPALERQPFMRTEHKLLIAETLIHHLDVTRWLLGPLRVLCARARRTVDAVAGETMASIFLETADGCPVLVEGNMAVPGAPAKACDRLQIIGERGAIELRDSTLTLDGEQPSSSVHDLDHAYQASFDAAIAHFVEGLRTGRPFETDGTENLATLKLVEDAYEAAGLAAY
jgi:predicted dehydrogenase